ncbi:uncharacterized protein LOC126847878 [Adelges cooleyi]|uniref:uncharacterized protein LOC126841688 n=1 Tax=Adelges cooleyi TaxID=133065 RepID=UPI00217F5C02|nr:uncharacterized protein LOC126841688 [Adelges cooleyi]XP_050444250.1 uncharacterized protein LOC126847878 [Adelges cooleyi]
MNSFPEKFRAMDRPRREKYDSRSPRPNPIGTHSSTDPIAALERRLEFLEHRVDVLSRAKQATPARRPQTLEGLCCLTTETVVGAAPQSQRRTQPWMKYGTKTSSGMAVNSSYKPPVPPRHTSSASQTILPPVTAASGEPIKSYLMLLPIAKRYVK